MLSDPKKLLDAMEEARDAIQGASVSEVIAAHRAGMDIIPNDMVRRPTLIVPRKIYEAVKEKLLADPQEAKG